MPPEPRPARDLGEDATDVGVVVAPEDVDAPASESRLDDERRWQAGPAAEAHVLASRLFQTGCRKEGRRAQLVVGVEQSLRVVDDAYAAPPEIPELEESGLDVDERPSDVDAPDRDVACTKLQQRVVRREERHIEAELSPALDEIGIRLVVRTPDDGDSLCVHGVPILAGPARTGIIRKGRTERRAQ